MPKPTAIITALITERPLCLECLLDKSRCTFAVVDEAVDRIARVLTLHRVKTRCHACGTIRSTVSVDRPE
jgi:hypothetical protein